jgi:hypothetical protein
MAAFLVILFQLLLLCLQHVSPCVSLTIFNINIKAPLLGILRSCRQRLVCFPPGDTDTTHSLALLFEAYDVIQDPSFRSTTTSTSTNTAWKMFDGIVSDVEATREGVVAGQGLVAKRTFQAGEVVALYPIHALGYANVNANLNNGIPIPHEPSQRRFPSLSSRTRMLVSTDTTTTSMEEAGNIIVGTSDLVCFNDEARHFGVVTAMDTATTTPLSTEEEDDGNMSTSVQPQQFAAAAAAAPVDYTYAMLDPSERYVFDVNPSRTVSSSSSSSMFVAHLVNDAAAADFSFSSANATLLDFDETVRTAVAYLDESLANFNVVMTPFGPPPLMAYVTVKPVEAGTELLATYGLDYWLGKVDDDNNNIDNDNDDGDVQDALRRRLEDVPRVRQKIDRADDIVAAALKAAKAAVRSSRYKHHTDLMGRAVADLMLTVEAVPAVPAAPREKVNRRSWWRRIFAKRRC